VKFIKMHGAGNDYVYLDLFAETLAAEPSALAERISDRHFGIGSDGLILIMPSERADVRMRMFNADGSESAMCGNGIRCLAKYVLDEGLCPGPELTVETGRGVLTLSADRGPCGLVTSVSVDMGAPMLLPADIPAINLGEEPVIARMVEFAAPPEWSGSVPIRHEITLISMGNPHCVLFVNDLDHFPVDVLGPLIERDRRFPERCNVHFVELIEDCSVRMRSWERGSGETLACGTGASAVCVALGLIRGWRTPVRARLPGGELTLHWREDGHVLMRGPAVEVFRGEMKL